MKFINKNIINYLLIIVFVFPIINNAQDNSSFSFSFGQFNFLRDSHKSLEGRFEYRLAKVKYDAVPFAGAMFNTDGALFLYGGLSYDYNILGNFYFTPSFAPGIYHKGNSKNLDFIIEFRSQLELTYKFENGLKIGINFNHISNGRLSLYNPGVESLGLTYILPL